jgi:glycosyltransferase involved in cell wall biosynthesis
MTPVRVLWVIDHVCYDGSLHGGGRLFMNLLPAFDDTQVQVFPYFLRASPEVRQLFDGAPTAVTTLDKSKYDPTALGTLVQLCRHHRIEVMHLFCYASSTFGRLAGLWTGIPAVIHDFDTQIYFPYPLYLRALDRLLAPGTARALAASPMCRTYMHERRALPLGRIELMPHAIPAERFRAARELDRDAARRELGWTPEQRVLCTFTKLGPGRGSEYLLRGFAQAAAARPELRLAFVYKATAYHRVPRAYAGMSGIHDGAGMQRSLQTLATELGIAERVEWHEALDEPGRFYAACDALVVPFLDERFSSVHLLEGLAHGRPAIATDLGEQAELLRDSAAGRLVPPGDEKALAEALLELASDDAVRAERGRAASALARQYSVSACAERLARLYHSLRPAPAQAAG